MLLKKYGFRAANVVLGILLIGIGVGVFRMAIFGCDPFTAMNLGISRLLGLQFGTLQLGVNAVLLLLVFVFRRKLIGFGTVVNMVGVGYTADFTVFLFHPAGTPEFVLPIRIALLIFAVLIVCLGEAFYIKADMGLAPYDAVGYIIEDKTNGKLPFKYARIFSDILCVTVGILTSLKTGSIWSILGLGTIIMACCTGPLTQFFMDHAAAPLFARQAAH